MELLPIPFLWGEGQVAFSVLSCSTLGVLHLPSPPASPYSSPLRPLASPKRTFQGISLTWQDRCPVALFCVLSVAFAECVSRRTSSRMGGKSNHNIFSHRVSQQRKRRVVVASETGVVVCGCGGHRRRPSVKAGSPFISPGVVANHNHSHSAQFGLSWHILALASDGPDRMTVLWLSFICLPQLCFVSERGSNNLGS